MMVGVLFGEERPRKYDRYLASLVETLKVGQELFEKLNK